MQNTTITTTTTTNNNNKGAVCHLSSFCLNQELGIH